MKQAVLEILRERLQKFNYEFDDAHQQAWIKFLSFIFMHVSKEDHSTGEDTQMTLSSDPIYLHKI